jgi:hypothetical protein
MSTGKLAALEAVIFAERDRKREEPRQWWRTTSPDAASAKRTAEEASQGVQRGGNEHPLQQPAHPHANFH